MSGLHKPRRQVVQVTKFCKTALSICGFSVRDYISSFCRL